MQKLRLDTSIVAQTMTRTYMLWIFSLSLALSPIQLFAWEVYEESKVDGTTEAVSSGTIIRTTRGRVYEVISGYEYEYEYRPDIMVLRSGTRYRLLIENFDDEFSAICHNCEGALNSRPPLTNNATCYNSSIQAPTPFLGNGGETIVLEDGTIWIEVSYQYLYLYEYYPSVIVCPSSGRMILRDNEFIIAPIGN